MNPDEIKNLTIETPRLILRQPTLDDLPAIHAAKESCWDDLRQWMSWTADGQETLAATEAFIRKSQTRWDDGSLMFMGFCRDTGAFVISSGLNHKDGEGIVFETGYWMPRAWRGKGYASETCNAMIRTAFDVMGAARVTIGHFAGNEPSRRVIERAGFAYTRTREKGMMQFSSGAMVDELCYARTGLDGLAPLEYRVIKNP